MAVCLTPAPESEDEYSDDDDMSWKVRRAAAKCMAALISSRPDLLPDFHCTLAPELIRRFKEREENVKADIFGAYIVLLRHTRPPKGWLEAVEEPTQTGSNLNMLRAQVGCVHPYSLLPFLLPISSLAEGCSMGASLPSLGVQMEPCLILGLCGAGLGHTGSSMSRASGSEKGFISFRECAATGRGWQSLFHLKKF